MLDKITAVSGNEKVTYVGFQAGGSAAIWGLATMEDQYAAKVDKAVLLAPAVYVTTAGIDFYNSIFPILRAELINLVLRPFYW